MRVPRSSEEKPPRRSTAPHSRAWQSRSSSSPRRPASRSPGSPMPPPCPPHRSPATARTSGRPSPCPGRARWPCSTSAAGTVLWVVDQIWALAVPAADPLHGALGPHPRPGGQVGRSWFLTIGVYVVLYTAIVFAVSLPLSYLSGLHPTARLRAVRADARAWLGNALKFEMVSMAVGFGFAWVPLLAARAEPEAVVALDDAADGPVPVRRDAAQADLGRPALQRLRADEEPGARARHPRRSPTRAGIEGSRVFEVDKSRDTKTVNAYVTGVLGTKRIVLWDTLVAKLGEKELLFVMAHEMGHYVLGHVVRSDPALDARHPGRPLRGRSRRAAC